MMDWDVGVGIRDGVRMYKRFEADCGIVFLSYFHVQVSILFVSASEKYLILSILFITPADAQFNHILH